MIVDIYDLESIVFIVVTYLVKLVIKPNKTEAKYLTTFISGIIILLFKMIKKYHKDHGHLSPNLDKLYHRIFPDKDDTIRIG